MALNEYLMNRLADLGFTGLTKRIVCNDGFSLSVQANEFAYCSPRDNFGPWDAVEVGFPSDIPTEIMNYVEDSANPTETVYGYVPIGLVEELIANHGGMKENV